MEYRKNDIVTLKIEDCGIDGEGIGKADGFTVFVKDAVIGDTVRAKIMKAKKNYGYGRLEEIITPSPDRVEPKCQFARQCGGCQLQALSYEKQLEFKTSKVRGHLERIGGFTDIPMEKILGMDQPFHYRNKAQFPVGINEKGEPTVGVFAQRTHTIIPIKECLIQTQISQRIANRIVEFIKENNFTVYNEQTQEGLFRHVVIKVGIKTNQVMCILVLNEKDEIKEKYNSSNSKSESEKLENLVEMLKQEFPEIKTIVKNINNKNTNVILGNKNINLYGEGYIEDILGEYKFKISPMSFYQVNPVQAEILYNTAIEAAQLSQEDTLFDLYCGIGTIGIFASKKVKQVYGIEIVEQAIEDAKENAKINNVQNAEFICGDVEFAFDELINKKKITPTAIIVDPPRKGLDDKTIQNILKLKTKKLVYVSCNPATMVRDIAKMEDEYEVQRIQPVDMFPFSKHVESVAVLNLK